MSALVTIGSDRFPDPDEYIVDRENVGNFERNANGRMIGDLIAQKTKISCSWGLLENGLYQQLVKAAAPFFVSVTYYDPESNGYHTKDMVLSLKGGRLALKTGDQLYWSGASVQMTER